MKTIKLLLSILSLILVMGCDDNGTYLFQTRVMGTLTDIIEAPATNLTVKVGEYQIHNNGWFSSPDYTFKGWVAQTETNASGYYEMLVNTYRKDYEYRVIIGEEIGENEQSEFARNMPISVTIPSERHGLSHVYNSDELLKVHPCDVSIMFNSIQNLELTPFNSTTNSASLLPLQPNVNTVQRIYIPRYYGDAFYLRRTLANGQRQRAKYIIPGSHDLVLTTHQIQVNESDFENF